MFTLKYCVLIRIYVLRNINDEVYIKYTLHARANCDYEISMRSRDKNWSVCSYHVTYAFQSESTLYSCLAKWLSVRL